MNFQDRLSDIRRRMQEGKLGLLVALHDGAHFIEKPNPVMVVTGFKSLGAAAAILRPDGATDLIVAPAWDAERAQECCPSARVIGANDVVEALLRVLPNGAQSAELIGILRSGAAAVAAGGPYHASPARRAPGRQARVRRGTLQDRGRDRRRPRGGAYRRARLCAAVADCEAGHDRGRACGRAQMHHENAGSRG